MRLRKDVEKKSEVFRKRQLCCFENQPLFHGNIIAKQNLIFAIVPLEICTELTSECSHMSTEPLVLLKLKNNHIISLISI